MRVGLGQACFIPPLMGKHVCQLNSWNLHRLRLVNDRNDGSLLSFYSLHYSLYRLVVLGGDYPLPELSEKSIVFFYLHPRTDHSITFHYTKQTD